MRWLGVKAFHVFLALFFGIDAEMRREIEREEAFARVHAETQRPLGELRKG